MQSTGASAHVFVDPSDARRDLPLVADPEEPPEQPRCTGRRHPAWRDVADAQWEDWRWQMQHAVRKTSDLARLVPMSAEAVALLETLEARFKLSIPPYYLSLADVDDPNDPILLQSLPATAELEGADEDELSDPLGEEDDSPVPGLTHRYPDRVLLVTTPVCSMYCRFCTRKRVTMEKNGWEPTRAEQRMIEYIASQPGVHDIVLSGGDALMLPPNKLRWFLDQLSAIPHVDVIRIGTRVPVTLPQKLFDPELVGLLASYQKVWIQTHFNHPRELTPEAERACRNLVRAGLPVNNHTVLLRGVNDSVPVMRELLRGLLRIKVRPYYLFHCDPIMGAGHFRTSVWKGIEIIEGLRGHMSGLGIPTYVVDGLHGAGKIPLMPSYLVSASEDAIVLRNAEGMIFRYDPRPGGPAPASSHSTTGYASTGVSGLLGDREASPLLPPDTPRAARRSRIPPRR